MWFAKVTLKGEKEESLLCHKVGLEPKVTERIMSGYYLMVAILYTCAAALECN